MKKYTICFTGHRPKGLPWGYNENTRDCLKFKQYIKELIIQKIGEGYNYFIVGMALGIDIIIVEILLELKQEYDIIIECAIPCLNQECKWSISQQKRYKDILMVCDKITYVSKEYTIDCMQKRNEYMVDNSDLVIAIWNGTPSGTLNTIKYAKSKDIKTIIIDVNKYK
ncbi:MAG: DUF1273 family protein [Clostridia bacterium]|nr:DUF1273 family protein [Clostridia bacterium]